MSREYAAALEVLEQDTPPNTEPEPELDPMCGLDTATLVEIYSSLAGGSRRACVNGMHGFLVRFCDAPTLLRNWRVEAACKCCQRHQTNKPRPRAARRGNDTNEAT